MKKIIISLFIFCINLQLFAQTNIYLKSKTIDYSKEQKLDLSLDDNYCLIVFDIIPNNQKKQDLELLGIQFLEYLPRNTFLINLPKSFDTNTLNSYGVLSIINVLPEYKLDPKIQNNKLPSWAFQNNKLSIKIILYNDVDIDKVQENFNVLGYDFSIKDVKNSSFILSIRKDDLIDISLINQVWYIEPIDPPSVPENKTARTLHRSNAINTNINGGKKYNGEGINIMMQDDGLVGPHIDRQGRVDQSYCNGCSSNINNDHGDHVSGTIMGAGNLDPTTAGMADGSFLYVFGSSNNNYDDVPMLYQNQDVIITSKSYSNGCNAGYTSLAKDLDEQIRLYPSLTHVFSAGNDGNSDCGYGAGAGWGNVTGGHKQAKNVIAVANLTQISNLAGSSSRGPAADGRIKPDVGAKGTSVNSTLPNNTYDSFTGTSMACPGVAGCMAQLYQAYKELNGGSNPSSALMKCVVLNSADDLGNPGPDFKHGWGEINVLRGLTILENNNYESGTISQGNDEDHIINVPAGTKEIKVMVYWHDKEASTNASIALVNDLDITLTSPTGTIIYPWVLDPTPNSSILNTPAIQGVDDLNNMEQVTIKNPAAGAYTLTINGTAVPYGPQQYFMTYEIKSNEITLTYPIGGEGLVPGEFELIRWDAPEDNNPFVLEYTLDNGLNWNIITNNAGVNSNFYNWNIPSAINGIPVSTELARVRISRNGISDESDANFTIIDVPDVSVNWICPDSIYVLWNTVSGATEYEVSMLGQKYMDSMTTVVSNGNPSQSALILNPNPNILDSWFSVCAKKNDGKGRRDIAVNAQPINSSCAAPPVADFIVNDPISCSGEVSFEDNSYGQPSNWLWDFGDGNTSTLENPIHTYLSEGVFDVSLFVSNSLGQDSILITSVVVVDFADPPITFNDTSYVSPASFTLTSLSNTVNWYADTLGSSSLGSGSTFITPTISVNTTYYAQESGGPIVSGGPINNNIGGGSFYNNDRHIYIDCFKASKLISADVYAGTSHNVTFELRDNNSQILDDKTIFLQVGLNTLQLDFDLPVMNDLELGVSSTGTDLFRNNSGASYPYPLGNIASITGHNSPYPGDTNYHYFFYNLQVQETCLSNFSPAHAVFITPSNQNELDENHVLIYPNPAKDKIFIQSDHHIKSVEIFDVSGKICFYKSQNFIDPSINISELSKGIYTIKVINDKTSFQSKLFVN